MKLKDNPTGWKGLISFLLSKNRPKISTPRVLAESLSNYSGVDFHETFPRGAELSSHLKTLTESVATLTQHVKRAEEARVRSNYIARHISDAYVCLDRNGNVKEINPAFLKVFLLDNLLESESTLSVLQAPELMNAVKFLTASLKDSESGVYQEVILEQEGKPKYLGIFKVEAETPVNLETLIFIKDVTEHKKHHQLIESNQKMLGSLSDLKESLSTSWSKANQSTLRLLTLNLFAVRGMIVESLEEGPRVVEEFKVSRSKPTLSQNSLDFIQRLFLNKAVSIQYKALSHPEGGSSFVVPISFKQVTWGFFVFYFEDDRANQLTELEINATLAAKEIYEAAVECEQSDIELMNTTDFNNRILSELPTPVFVRDSQGNYVAMSEAFKALLGETKTDISQASHLSQEMLRDKQVDQQMLNQGHGNLEYHGVLVNHSTSEKRMGTFKKTAIYGSDQTVFILSTFLDLTEQIKATKSIEDSNKRVTSLLDLFASLNSGGFEQNIKRFLKLFCENYSFQNATLYLNHRSQAEVSQSYKKDWTLASYSQDLLERQLSRKAVPSSFIEHRTYQNFTYVNYYSVHLGKVISVLTLCSRDEISQSIVDDPEFLLVLKVYELASMNHHFQSLLKKEG